MREWVNRVVAKIGMDKIAHFFGSAFLTLAIGRFLHPAIAAATTLSLGLAKEMMDKGSGGKLDGKDLVADALGIILGVLIRII